MSDTECDLTDTMPTPVPVPVRLQVGLGRHNALRSLFERNLLFGLPPIVSDSVVRRNHIVRLEDAQRSSQVGSNLIKWRIAAVTQTCVNQHTSAVTEIGCRLACLKKGKNVR